MWGKVCAGAEEIEKEGCETDPGKANTVKCVDRYSTWRWREGRRQGEMFDLSASIKRCKEGRDKVLPGNGDRWVVECNSGRIQTGT